MCILFNSATFALAALPVFSSFGSSTVLQKDLLCVKLLSEPVPKKDLNGRIQETKYHFVITSEGLKFMCTVHLHNSTLKAHVQGSAKIRCLEGEPIASSWFLIDFLIPLIESFMIENGLNEQR